MSKSKQDIAKDQEVLNFNTARDEKIEERRRSYERILFQNVLGVYTVLEQKGLHAIELIDISESGVSFQVSQKSEFNFSVGDTIVLRLYFSSENYLPLQIKIVRSFDKIHDGVKLRQYGCSIDKSFSAYKAVYHFVQFIANCAEFGKEDKEHLKIFY